MQCHARMQQVQARRLHGRSTAGSEHQAALGCNRPAHCIQKSLIQVPDRVYSHGNSELVALAFLFFPLLPFRHGSYLGKNKKSEAYGLGETPGLNHEAP